MAETAPSYPFFHSGSVWQIQNQQKHPVRRKILVVDDEERMVRFIRLNLEHDGFQVVEANRGMEAIQTIRDQIA